MTTRTLRRPEWVALLAATLVATLIATMFAFTSAAHATEESHSDETPVVISEADDANDSPRSVDEAGEQVDEGLLLRGPDPILLPESTPDPEAHNNGAPGIETNPAGPEQHNETEPLDEADQVEEVKQLEETTQPEKVSQLEEAETSDYAEQLTAQSNHGDEASDPDIDLSVTTATAQQSQVASLMVNPDPGDAHGAALASGKVELTANCGTTPSLGFRRLTVLDRGGNPITVFAEFGSWSGPFTVTDYVPQAGRTPATLEYELYCGYGPNPPRTAYASVPVSEAFFRTEVTYPNGAPVTDLTVRARDINSGFEIELDSWSDGYESYVFPGTYLVEYYNPDGSLRTLRSANVDGYDDKVRVDVTLSFPPPGTVSGTVTWADGSPLIDQQVVLGGAPTLEDPISGMVSRTDANGAYEFPEIPVGEYTVRVLHDSHGYVAWAPVTVEAGGDHIVDMELDLSAPGALHGNATFSDGTPVVSDGNGPGNVELIDASGTQYAHTDADGNFAFENLPHGAYELRVTGAYRIDIGDIDYTSDLIEIDVIPAVTTNQDVVIAMPQGSVKGGVFSDLDYVTPIPDVVVSIPALNVGDDTTATNGSFHIDGVEGANKMFVIEVRTEDGVLLGSREWMLVIPGEQTSVPIYVTPPASLGTVDGTITWSNGAPVDDAEVRLVPESGGASLTAPVDSDGTYELIGVTAGDYTAEVIVDGDVLQDRAITVTSGGTTTEDFVLLLAGAIDGEARWADLSGPVDGVEVEITDGAVVLNDTTGPLGQFGFDDLAPGMWHLTATYDSNVIFTGPINVPDGLTVGVVLDVPVPVVTPDTGNVEGTVTWDDGTPVDGETMRLVAVGGGSSVDTTTNADGTYEFSDVEVGDYLVQVIIDGDVAAEQAATVDADQTTTVDLVIPVLVVTPDSGAIDGEARWADLSGPVDGVEVEITDGAVVLNDTTGPLGQFGFDDLAPGMWHLTATYDGDVVASHIVTVTEGVVSAVTIDVPVPAVTPDTGGIEGTMTWDDGTPVDGEAVLLVPVSGGTTLDTATNTDGTYEFSDVEVGDYLVQVIIDGDVAAEQAATVDADQTTTVDLVVATANDSDTGSTPDDEAEEPKPSDSDGSDDGALPQTGLSSDTSALLFVAPLLLMLGLLTMWTARRNGVRRDLPK